MARSHRRTSITITLLAALIGVAALAAACSAQATGGSSPLADGAQPGSSPSLRRGERRRSQGRRHRLVPGP